MNNNTCNILIKEATKERLKKIGFKDQTYDDIIKQLLDLKNSSNPNVRKELTLHD